MGGAGFAEAGFPAVFELHSTWRISIFCVPCIRLSRVVLHHLCLFQVSSLIEFDTM